LGRFFNANPGSFGLFALQCETYFKKAGSRTRSEPSGFGSNALFAEHSPHDWREELGVKDARGVGIEGRHGGLAGRVRGCYNSTGSVQDLARLLRILLVTPIIIKVVVKK
jgi:hypothetical protein